MFALQSRTHLHFTSFDAANLQRIPADRPSGDFKPHRSRSFHTTYLHASYAVKPKPGALFPRARNSRMLLHINWITECSVHKASPEPILRSVYSASLEPKPGPIPLFFIYSQLFSTTSWKVILLTTYELP